MPDQTTTPHTGDPTTTDLADTLRARLAELGTDVDQLSPEDENTIGELLFKLDWRERDQLCELIALRLGRSGRDWPKWLDNLHDQAREDDNIAAGRKRLADALDAIIGAVTDAQRARQELAGNRGSGMWDIEHAEGGTHFQHALEQLAFYAEAAKALNPTRDM